MRSASVPRLIHARFGWFVALVASLAAAACQSAQSGRNTPRMDRSVLTRDQMLRGDYSTVFDAVAATHNNWLKPRTPSNVSIVLVYIDGTKSGSVDVLRGIQPRLVNTVRFYDGATATSRWGVDHASGVIYVSTFKAGDAGIPIPDSTRRVPKATGDSAGTQR